MDTAEPKPTVEDGGNELANLPPENQDQIAPIDQQSPEQEQVPNENNEQTAEDGQELSHQLSQSLQAVSKVKLYYLCPF